MQVNNKLPQLCIYLCNGTPHIGKLTSSLRSCVVNATVAESHMLNVFELPTSFQPTISKLQKFVTELKRTKSQVYTFLNCHTVIQMCSTTPHPPTHSPVLCRYQCQLKDFSRASASCYPAALWWESIHRKCSLLFHAWRPCEENINAMTHGSVEALYTHNHTHTDRYTGVQHTKAEAVSSSI